MTEPTTHVPPRVVAVDWSGAKGAAEQRKKIWLCEVADGRVVRLEAGRDRAGVTAELAGLVRAARDAEAPLAIGLDFAFSLPAWFLAREGCADAPALWARATERADAWLSCAEPPFWGRGGTKRDESVAAFRGAESEVAAAVGARPSSTFKLVGPDQVGAASIRGMATLTALREAGARVWPFDDAAPGAPVVVEIWPRAAYAERVVKSDAAARAAYLDRHAPALDAAMRADAERSDDAFDALAAALALWDDRATLAALPPARSAEERLEGRIWWPGLPIAEDAESAR